MGKKKRSYPDVEDVLARPWCYYCERDFDDLKILISHQKAKHFKCERCGRRLNTAGGLNVHMSQVHKEQLTSVENALPNRQGLEVEIFGMEGIPDDIAQAHNQRVLQQFYEAQAERRAKSGNLAPGEQPKRKKVKVETEEELRSRLAEWKLTKRNGGDMSADTQDVPASNSPAPISGPPRASPAQVGGFAPPSQQPQAASGMFPTGYSAGGAPGLPARPPGGSLPFNPQMPPPQPGFGNIGGGTDDAALDELIASATRPSAAAPPPTVPSQALPPAIAKGDEKKSKKEKEKDKNSKMMWSDNDVSPEEIMATWSRYSIYS